MACGNISPWPQRATMVTFLGLAPARRTAGGGWTSFLPCPSSWDPLFVANTPAGQDTYLCTRCASICWTWLEIRGRAASKKKTEAQDVAAIRPARRTKLRRQCCSGLEIAAGNGRRRVARTSTIEEQGTRKSASFRRHVVGLMPASRLLDIYGMYSRCAQPSSQGMCSATHNNPLSRTLNRTHTQVPMYRTRPHVPNEGNTSRNPPPSMCPSRVCVQKHRRRDGAKTSRNPPLVVSPVSPFSERPLLLAAV